MIDSVMDEVEARWSELATGKNWLQLTTLLNPMVLVGLSVEAMERLLNLLPQVGALKGREPGTLRVVSCGWHFHIQGSDRRFPHWLDFFIRCNGVLSAINLVLRIPPSHLDEISELFSGMPVGDEYDLVSALVRIQEESPSFCVTDIELVQHRICRPGVPNVVHWSTPGGIQSLTESNQKRSLLELSQEAPGLVTIASGPLLYHREYQSGNVVEFHSVTGRLCIGEPRVSAQAASEGISEYCFVPLSQVFDWFDKQCAVPLESPECNIPGGKTEHALLKLYHMCCERVIW